MLVCVLPKGKAPSPGPGVVILCCTSMPACFSSHVEILRHCLTCLLLSAGIEQLTDIRLSLDLAVALNSNFSHFSHI